MPGDGGEIRITGAITWAELPGKTNKAEHASVKHAPPDVRIKSCGVIQK